MPLPTADSLDRLFFHIEQITRRRDRSAAVVALLEALRDLLDVHSAGMHCLLMPPGDILVGLVATTNADGTTLHYDGLAWPDELVSIECLPHLQACLQSHGPHYDTEPASGLQRLTLPLAASGDEPSGFVTLLADHPLAAEDPLIGGLFGVFANHRRLLDYAEVDTLTQLLNRKTFDECLLRILSRTGDAGDLESGALHLPHRRQPRPRLVHHWLGVVDIDHFKRINDGFGHLIGDEVLILLANMMRSCFRAQDRLFRFGGEEFVVLLNPTEHDNALHVFERFRCAVADFRFPQVGRVTVSAGFARIAPGDTPSVIFDNADEALYWAKDHGRNRVCSYEQLLATGELHQRVAPNSDIEFF